MTNETDIAEEIEQTAPQTPVSSPEEQDTNFIDNFISEVQEYSTKNADFSDAFNYLVELRDKQLAQYSALYPELNDANKRNQQIEREAFEIIKKAQQSGSSAADFMYNLATNLGYKNEQLERSLAQKNEAKKAARTLAATAGASVNLPNSVEALSSLSQEEFDAWYWNNKQEFKKIMSY